MKGNHDYWWSTVNKMNAYLKAEGFDTLHILHNNSYSVEGYALCGTRGWLFDAGEAHDEKVMNREIGRLRMSLDAALARIFQINGIDVHANGKGADGLAKLFGAAAPGCRPLWHQR